MWSRRSASITIRWLRNWPVSPSSFFLSVILHTSSQLSDVKSRWVILKQKVIAHKSHDGWRIGKVWKQGVGKKYGGMIWVTYGGGHKQGRA